MSKVFEAVLEARFRQCPGHRKITRKEYALRSNTQDRDIERTVDFRRCFLPGRRVEMSMIFERILFEVDVCPRCNLPFPGNTEYRQSYIEWYNSLAPSVVHVLTYCSGGCSLRYQRTFKQLETKISAAMKATDQAFLFALYWSNTTIVNSFHHQRLRFLKGGEEDTPDQFRRVRLKSWHDDAARKLSQKIYVDLSDFVFKEFEISFPGVFCIGTRRFRSSVEDHVLAHA